MFGDSDALRYFVAPTLEQRSDAQIIDTHVGKVGVDSFDRFCLAIIGIRELDRNELMWT